jgi:hypothetical protein
VQKGWPRREECYIDLRGKRPLLWRTVRWMGSWSHFPVDAEVETARIASIATSGLAAQSGWTRSTEKNV